MLAAADGIHSALRRKLYPDEGFPVSGTDPVALHEPGAQLLSGRSMIWPAMPRQKFVAYPSATARRPATPLNYLRPKKAVDGPIRQE